MENNNNTKEIIDNVIISDNNERISLLIALRRNLYFLQNVNPKNWDDNDSEGSLNDAISSTIRLLNKARKIKL